MQLQLMIDRLLISQVEKLESDQMTGAVRRIKLILFPNNGYPASRPPDPTIEEQLQIYESLKSRLIEAGSCRCICLYTLLLIHCILQPFCPLACWGKVRRPVNGQYRTY
jgi:hypothetical protein